MKKKTSKRTKILVDAIDTVDAIDSAIHSIYSIYSIYSINSIHSIHSIVLNHYSNEKQSIDPSNFAATGLSFGTEQGCQKILLQV